MCLLPFLLFTNFERLKCPQINSFAVIKASKVIQISFDISILVLSLLFCRKTTSDYIKRKVTNIIKFLYPRVFVYMKDGRKNIFDLHDFWTFGSGFGSFVDFSCKCFDPMQLLWYQAIVQHKI
jgi:hypothetical protein